MLYTTDFKRRTATGGFREYDGYEGIALENTEGNVVYFSIDLDNLDGNNNLDAMLQEVIVNRLGFN